MLKLPYRTDVMENFVRYLGQYLWQSPFFKAAVSSRLWTLVGKKGLPFHENFVILLRSYFPEPFRMTASLINKLLWENIYEGIAIVSKQAYAILTFWHRRCIQNPVKLKPLTIFIKSSILDICQSFEFASGNGFKNVTEASKRFSRYS